jgi:hypothetical protein
VYQGKIQMKVYKEVLVRQAFTVCDLCGKEKISLFKCNICGKEVCEQCSSEGNDEFEENGYYDGDYAPYRICKSCWKNGESFLSEIHQFQTKLSGITKKYDLLIEELVKNWKSKMKEDDKKEKTKV